jgi:hypothetical protein
MQIDDKKESQEKEDLLKNYVDEQEQHLTKETAPISTVSQVGPKITEIPGANMPWDKKFPLGNQIGWIPIKVEDLPTRGLFYPQDIVVAIRSATGAEIRHWSTLDETDFSALDDMLNYVIERCVTIKAKNPESGLFLSWKDIKEVDRFYLLLAIHELTFPNGENKLQVNISDTKKIDVKKDMVSYISLDPQIMKHYNEDERCFVLKIKGGRMLVLDLPSIGVTQWLKNYIIRKQRMQEYIDEDYLNYAPFLIRSWKGLNDDLYKKFLEESNKWDITTISLLVQFKQIFSDTINPVVKFSDEGGTEQTAPLNFQGGIKSLFLIPDPFGQLD